MVWKEAGMISRLMRAEIANGTFESAERINGTATRLLDLIR